MKKMIYKPIKIFLIAILGIGTAFLVFRMISALTIPVFKEEKTVLNELQHSANVDYTVKLRPNILYTEPSLGMGMSYINEYVDEINAKYSYNLNALNDISVKGDYELYALVEGMLEEKEKLITIWQKKFPLKSSKQINYTGNELTITENVSINLSHYNEFAKEVMETSKVICDARMTVLMDINVNTSDTNVPKKVIPSMTFKLNSNLFTIDGNLSYNDVQSIEKSSKIPVPAGAGKVMIYALPVIVLLLLMTLLILFTEGYEYKDPYLKEIKKIFKEYGDRLVALREDTSAKKNCDSLTTVKSFNDLVRLSDELGRPIMYHFCENKRDITEFFVSDSHAYYSYEFVHRDDPGIESKDYTQEILRLKAEGKLYK